MLVQEFHSLRRFVDTVSGRIAYIEQGNGPVAVFVHGVPLNGFHWRYVIARLREHRRCIALDLMGLGYTQIDGTQDVSFTAQARMLKEFIDALAIEQVDLVANDSGGAIAQIFAATHPESVRTLTLTNCDVHDNWPPAVIQPMIDAARRGVLVDDYAQYIDNAPTRRARFQRGYLYPDVLTDDVYRVYIEPLLATAKSRDNFHRYWTSFDCQQTVALESKLRTLQMPTLIVWALDDIFFEVRWAYWLRRTIPGFARLVEVPRAKLFFPEDCPDELVEPLISLLKREDSSVGTAQ